MDVANYNLVFTLIIGLDLPHAERNEASFTIGDELEAATLNDLSNPLVELESGRRIAFHLDREVASLVCWNDFYLNMLVMKQFLKFNLH